MWELYPKVETVVSSLKFASTGVYGPLEVLTEDFPTNPRSVTAPGFDRVTQIYFGDLVQFVCSQKFHFPTYVTVPVCFMGLRSSTK